MEKTSQGKGIIYLDGDFVTVSEAKISIFDSAFVHGDSVQEFTRTFNGKLFKFDEHIARLCRTLKSTRIDPGISPEEIKEITYEVLERNNKFGDGWVIHLLSYGILPKWKEENVEYKKSTIVIFFKPFRWSFGKYYKTGVHVITPPTRRVSPLNIDPKMKHCSRMDLNIASREVECMDPEAFALLLDQYGNITEGDGQNIFIINNKGVLQTPGTRNIMPGISRETVIDLAKELKIPLEEVDIQPYDLYNASEAFLTATSFCVMPVTRFNWLSIGDGKPGVIANRILKAWSKMVGVDIVKQAEDNFNKLNKIN